MDASNLGHVTSGSKSRIPPDSILSQIMEPCDLRPLRVTNAHFGGAEVNFEFRLSGFRSELSPGFVWYWSCGQLMCGQHKK